MMVLDDEDLMLHFHKLLKCVHDRQKAMAKEIQKPAKKSSDKDKVNQSLEIERKQYIR